MSKGARYLPCINNLGVLCFTNQLHVHYLILFYIVTEYPYILKFILFYQLMHNILQ
jgi:hypothetical protein